MTSGKYRLALYFSAQSVAHGNPGSEKVHDLFNVFCNHRAILQNFDLRSAGGEVVVRRFSGLEADAQDKLLLEFVPVKGYATVSGIEILPQ